MREPRSAPTLLALGIALLSGCTERPESVPEVPEEEVTPQVAELDAVHEVMVPMWHEAFPARDLEAIQASVGEFEPLLLDLDQAALPGILQEKRDQWDEGKARLLSAFTSMKTAAATGGEEDLLGAAEAFHMSYEAMVRIIRPVVPELDAFHRHLYGVYHYYGPGYDLEKIRAGADAMAVAIPPLQAAELPTRLADRQTDFEARVTDLGNQLAAFLVVLEDPERSAVEEGIELVHTAYQAVEAIFD